MGRPFGAERERLEAERELLYRSLFRTCSAFLISPMNDRALFEGPDDYTGELRRICARIQEINDLIAGRVRPGHAVPEQPARV